MEPILQGYFSKFIKTFEISIPNEAKIDDHNAMSGIYERFVNYSVLSTEDPDGFDLNAELLDFVGTGGTDDCKIDGFAIKINGRIIGGEEDIRRILGLNRQVDIEFITIQTKMSERLNTSDFLTYGLYVKEFFKSTINVANEHIKELHRLKNLIFNDRAILEKLKDNPRLTIYYTVTGKPSENDENFENNCEIIRNSFKNSDGDSDRINDIEIKLLSGADLVSICRNLENNYEVHINAEKTNSLRVGSDKRIKKAYWMTCRADEFLKLLTTDKGALRRTLFNDNVRDYLGDTGNVNREIKNTLVEEPELFLLYNNGITIVSSDFNPIRDDLVKITNPQIVNGCQTSNVIYQMRNSAQLDKVMLSVRVICTDDAEITNKVVKSTNKQNQVLEEAFEATKPFHQKLEKFFIFTTSPVNLFYERRIRQYVSDNRVPQSHIINLRTMSHAYASIIFEEPHMSARHEAKIIAAYKIEPKIIFYPNHSYYPYYVSALCSYMADRAFNINHPAKKYKTYKFFLLYIIRMISAPKLPPPFADNKEIEKWCLKFISNIDTIEKFSKLLTVAKVILESAKKQWQNAGNSEHSMKENPEFTVIVKSVINEWRHKHVVNQPSTSRDVENAAFNRTTAESNQNLQEEIKLPRVKVVGRIENSKFSEIRGRNISNKRQIPHGKRLKK